MEYADGGDLQVRKQIFRIKLFNEKTLTLGKDLTKSSSGELLIKFFKGSKAYIKII